MPDTKTGPKGREIEVLSWSWNSGVHFVPGEPPEFSSMAKFSDGSIVEYNNANSPALSLALYHVVTASLDDFEPFKVVVVGDDDGTALVEIFADEDGDGTFDDLIYATEVDNLGGVANANDIIFGGLSDDWIGSTTDVDYFVI